MQPSLLFYLFPFLSVLATVKSAPVASTYQQRGATCQDYVISMSVTSENWIFNATMFQDNYDLVNFTTAVSTVNSTSSFQPVEALPVTQTFDLDVSATFCTPASRSTNSGTVLLATHGIGADGSYWNFPFQPEAYSFTDHAIAEGYSVFYYDRIGAGQSTKLSGYKLQLSVHVEVLSQLAKLIRAGQHAGAVGVPESLVVLGFSFGSFITDTLVANEPTLMDGAIFTGLGFAPTAFAPFFEAYSPRIAATLDPNFGELDNGYITWVDEIANINTYAAPARVLHVTTLLTIAIGTLSSLITQPNYALDAVQFTEETKQPFTVMEAVSLQEGLGFNPNTQNFTGPILVLDGEFDFFTCAGYCPGFLEPSLTPYFAGSKSLEIALHPDSGHNINFNKNTTGAFGVLTDFLKRNNF